MTLRRLPVFLLSGALIAGLSGCAVAPEPAAPAASGSPAASTAPAAPRVAAMSPAMGPLAGGIRVSVTGQNLDAVTGVMFGDEPGTELSVDGPESVSVTTPAILNFRAGSVPVRVLTAAGDAVPGDLSFDYAAQTAVDRQMAYLFEHWKNYNSAEWGNMNPAGGDCTNFTSQGLIARGWSQSPRWNSPGVNASASTESWRYTPAMDQWLQSDTPRGAVRLELDQRDRLKIGDIGMFLWTGQGRPDHVMTVSSVKVVDGHTKVAFVSHNLDGDYRDLDELIAEKNAANTGGAQMKAWFYSIPE